MKNLSLTIVLGILILASCSKEDSLIDHELQNIDSVFILHQIEEASFWEPVRIDETQRNINPNNNTIQTNGHYQPISRNDMIITWTGEQNGWNTRGSAEIIQANPNFSFHFILETECVLVEGNEAVYGGVITQVRELTGDAPEIGLGWRFYFKVLDSGHSELSNSDQIANISFFVSPRSISLCNVLLPSNEVWSSQGYTDVLTPGYVEVRN